MITKAMRAPRSDPKPVKSKLLFVVQMPPPVHGVSYMNAMVVGDELLNKKAEIKVLPMRFARDIADIDRISVRKFIRMITFMGQVVSSLVTWKPDIVYFTPVPTGLGFIRDLLPMLLWRMAGVTRIYHLHGLGIGNKTQVYWRILYRLAFSGGHIVSISAAMQQQELEWIGPSSIKRHVIPNTVLPNHSRAKIRTKTALELRKCDNRSGPLSNKVVRLLFLSWTFRSKGVFVLLEAMRILRAQYGQFLKLEIVGNSSREVDEEITQCINTYGLKHMVIQRGALLDSAKTEALQQADIFVHPTQRDYFPLVLLEAMQVGLPLVATQVGAIGDIVDHGVNGLICRPNDAEDLANAISQLVSCEEKRRQFGAASQERFERLFSNDTFRHNLGQVFRAAGLK